MQRTRFGRLTVADFWTVFCVFYSRFDRWAVLGGSGAAISGHFRATKKPIPEIGPKSIGIGLCRFVGTTPGQGVNDPIALLTSIAWASKVGPEIVPNGALDVFGTEP